MIKQASNPCDAFVLPSRLAGLPSESPILLAFSGGADSRALLHLLAKTSARDGAPLLLAHVNHGIRGEEAIRDRDFCVQIAKEYELEICVLDADVPTLAAMNKRGLEEEARAVRYAFFERLMRERGIPILVTAHHADDNLETVLFRLCRGSGLTGICAIAPSRPFGGGQLVRPLLSCTREEILTYCRAEGLAYVTDSTNADASYTRNCLRAEVVPVLQRLFENPQQRVNDALSSLREDADYLDAIAKETYRTICSPEGIPCEALRDLPTPIRKRVLMRLIADETGCVAERVHLEMLEHLLRAGDHTGEEIALPRDHVAYVSFGNVRITARETDTMQNYDLPLSLGDTDLGVVRITVSLENEEKNRKVHNLYTQTCIFVCTVSDIMKSGYHWRNRREGDTILQGGMHKKLRRRFREAGVPARLRDVLPLLCDAEGILWAPFVGYRDGLAQQGDRYRADVNIAISSIQQKKDEKKHVSV